MSFGFANNLSTDLVAPVTTTDTTIELTANAAGAVQAALQSSNSVALTLFTTDASGEEVSREIVYATSVASPLVTVTRAQEGTTATAFAIGDGCENRLTSGALDVFLTNEGIGDGAVGIGPSVSATQISSVAVGNNASSTGSDSIAIGGYSNAAATNAQAIGYASSTAENGIAIGQDASVVPGVDGFGFANDEGTAGVAIGAYAATSGSYSLAVGGLASCEGLYAVCVGAAFVSGEYAVGIGRQSNVGPHSVGIGFDVYAASAPGQTSSVALGTAAYVDVSNSVGIGRNLAVSTEDAVALGPNANVGVTGGARLAALPYLPATVDDSGTTAATACRRNASQVVISSDDINLLDGTASTTVTLPTNARLFVDSLEVVITGVSGAGGSPTIQVGPDDTTPDAYLAPTAVSKVTVGGREIFSPLVTDGVSALRVSVGTAGAGTTYTARLIARGYVMEL